MARITTATERISHADPWVRLEQIRPTWREFVALIGCGAALFAVSFLFFQGAVALRPDPYGEQSGFRSVGFVGFGLVGFLLAGVGAYLIWLPIGRERQFARWAEDAHVQTLTEREKAGGMNIERTITEIDFNANDILHALGLLIATWRRAQEYRGAGPRPWSKQGMIGPFMIGRVGTGKHITDWQARQARKLWAITGIVRADTEKSAGAFVPDTLEEAVELLLHRWARLPTNYYDDTTEVDE